MKAKDKKTGKVFNFTDKQWARMVRLGLTKRYALREEVVISRLEMINTLKDRGYRVPANIGDDKLKSKFNESN